MVRAEDFQGRSAGARIRPAGAVGRGFLRERGRPGRGGPDLAMPRGRPRGELSIERGPCQEIESPARRRLPVPRVAPGSAAPLRDPRPAGRGEGGGCPAASPLLLASPRRCARPRPRFRQRPGARRPERGGRPRLDDGERWRGFGHARRGRAQPGRGGDALDAPAVARDVAALRALVLEEGAGRRLRARQRAQALLRVAFAERVMERPVQASADLAAALAIDPAGAADRSPSRPRSGPSSSASGMNRPERPRQARLGRGRRTGTPGEWPGNASPAQARWRGRRPPRLQRQRRRRFRRPSRPGPAP